MKPKLDNLANLIFEKLKKYNKKQISLEKENLKKFIFSLLNEN